MWGGINMGLKSKDLLGLKQLTTDEIIEILETAKMMKMVLKGDNKKTALGNDIVKDIQ